MSLFHASIGGRTSCAELAAVIGKDRSTAWRWVQHAVAQAKQKALVAEAAAETLKTDESGCRISPKTAQPIVGIDAWAASLFGFTARYSHRPTFEDFCAYLHRHEAVLFGRDDVYLGAWFDDETGEYCVDIRKLFRDKAAALAFARAHRQKAITNLETLLTIWLDEEDRRAA